MNNTRKHAMRTACAGITSTSCRQGNGGVPPRALLARLNFPRHVGARHVPSQGHLTLSNCEHNRTSHAPRYCTNCHPHPFPPTTTRDAQDIQTTPIGALRNPHANLNRSRPTRRCNRHPHAARGGGQRGPMLLRTGLDGLELRPSTIPPHSQQLARNLTTSSDN